MANKFGMHPFWNATQTKNEVDIIKITLSIFKKKALVLGLFIN